jgi:putative spermidine/putrescine transport system substrate-binding protein
VLATDEGVDRASAKLDTIKHHVLWWETHAQAPQLLADREVVMTTGANGRFYDAIEHEGQSFTIVWDHQIWNLDLWAIPVGAPNVDHAKAFIRFASQPERMADQTNYISYGPVRRSAAEMIAPGIRDNMPTAAANFGTAIQNNFEFWADRGDELAERFTSWLLAN